MLQSVFDVHGMIATIIGSILFGAFTFYSERYSENKIKKIAQKLQSLWTIKGIVSRDRGDGDRHPNNNN